MKKLLYLTITAFFTCSLAVINAQQALSIDLVTPFENNDRVFETELLCPGEIIPELLKEFKHGSIYYKVDYEKEFAAIKQVQFIKRDMGYLGDVSRDKTIIYLNRELLQYPNLLRVVFLRQMGKIYNAKDFKKGHAIMGEHWEIDSKHENYATYIRKFPEQRKLFFEHLQEVNPLTIHL